MNRQKNQTQWLTENSLTGQFNKPDYARFRAIVNFVEGENSKGYSRYPSIDWNNIKGRYDEQYGLEQLIKWIKSLPYKDYRVATIYANLTLDLSVNSAKYNYPVCCYRQGKNVWPGKHLIFMTIGNDTKVDVNATITESKLVMNAMVDGEITKYGQRVINFWRYGV